MFSPGKFHSLRLSPETARHAILRSLEKPFILVPTGTRSSHVCQGTGGQFLPHEVGSRFTVGNSKLSARPLEGVLHLVEIRHGLQIVQTSAGQVLFSLNRFEHHTYSIFFPLLCQP